MRDQVDDQGVSLRAALPSLVDGLPDVLDHVAELLSTRWPSYHDFLVTHRDEVLTAGSFALARIVDLAEQVAEGGEPGRDEAVDGELSAFRELGHAQWGSGESLSSLLSAYQAGARVAWRRMSQTAVGLGLAGSSVAELAEALFAFVDLLSRASTVGYVEAQSATAAERERARSELVELLLTDGTPPRLVEAVAVQARWSLPERSAVVLLDPANPVTSDVLSHLADDCLAVHRHDAIGFVLPYPSTEQRADLIGTLKGSGAVVGPVVPLQSLPASLRMAQTAAHLRAVGVLIEDPLFVDDHLDAVIVHRDERVLAALRTRTLAPLDGLPPETRQRLEETLRSWLWHMGDRQAVATELFIHRQTVRYRLAQLQTLFDGALDDPAFRTKLTLAVAWQPITTPVRHPEVPAPRQRT